MAIASLAIDNADRALTLVREAIAVQEMGSRIGGDNEEDFDMLQRACSMTFRTLEEAAALLEAALMQSTGPVSPASEVTA